ncbi:MAG: 16S rRNA (guanine(527)-N(7))-methyltransferase RsmG [Candidatus Acidiferrales bacterium]
MPSLSTTIVVYNGNEITVPAADAITGVMSKYGIGLSESQISQIQRYIACLVFWNQRVSLTSVSDPGEILERHFAECLLGAPLIRSVEGRLADVGTGPGFPGLALKIAHPKLQALLIERNTKKCAFLNEAIRSLDLSLISVIRSDYASISPLEAKFDYVTARALGDYKNLLRWASGRLLSNGEVMLWLGAQEFLRLSQSTGWRWDPPLPIPRSQRRVILMGHIIP